MSEGGGWEEKKSTLVFRVPSLTAAFHTLYSRPPIFSARRLNSSIPFSFRKSYIVLHQKKIHSLLIEVRIRTARLREFSKLSWSSFISRTSMFLCVTPLKREKVKERREKRKEIKRGRRRRRGGLVVEEKAEMKRGTWRSSRGGKPCNPRQLTPPPR